MATREKSSTESQHNVKFREAIEKFIVNEKSRTSITNQRPPQKALPDPTTYNPASRNSEPLERRSAVKEFVKQPYKGVPIQKKISFDHKIEPLQPNGNKSSRSEDLDALEEKFKRKPLPNIPLLVPTISNIPNEGEVGAEVLLSPKLPPKPKDLMVRTSLRKIPSKLNGNDVLFVVPTKKPVVREAAELEKWKNLHEKRTKIVHEIHDTEKFFCECVVSMVEVCV